MRDNDNDGAGVVVPELAAAAACSYCIVIGFVLAYIIVGIYFMTTDRYVCSDTPDQDMLW